jgi:outer membrane protein
MSRCLAFSLCIFLCLELGIIEHCYATPLTLDECYAKVIAERETLKVRQADIQAAEARYDQAFAEFYPRLTVNANQRYRDNPFFGSLSRLGFRDPSTGLPPSRVLGKSLFETTVNVTQPLFRGFREFAFSRASEAEKASFAQQLIRDRQLVYLDVADLYYQQLLYQEQEKALTRSQETLRLRIKELKDFISLGKSKESEQFAAEAELAQQGLTKEQTKKALAATREILASLLGTIGTEIELSPIEPRKDTPTIENLLLKTQERADIRARVEVERMMMELVIAEKGNWWPTLDLDLASIQVDDPNRNRDWEALMRLSIPVFDGGRISSRVAEREALYKRAQAESAEQRRLAEQEVRVSYQNLLHAKSARTEAQSLLNARQKSYHAQVSDYRAGRVTNLDVLTALNLLQQSELTLIEARFTEANDYARLSVASGEINS